MRSGARVAITGASSGIGEAAALAFAARGCKLALSARRAAELARVADACRAAGAPVVRQHRVDVTRDADLTAWAEDLRGAWGGLDVAVANAGVGHYGPFLDSDPAHLDQLVDTNLLGVWRTAHALGPLLSEARGHLVVVGSVAGRVPLPYMAEYAAIKAALVHWTRSVRPELAERGIALTLFAPGWVATPFASLALRTTGLRRPDRDHKRRRGQPAEHVAALLVRAADRRPREVHLTLQGRLGMVASALAPHRVARRLAPMMRPRPPPAP